MLPCTPMSAPGCALRSATTCASGPLTATAPAHSLSRGREVRTYLGTRLMKSAKEWLEILGQ
jgi:hypothetical protein